MSGRCFLRPCSYPLSSLISPIERGKGLAGRILCLCSSPGHHVPQPRGLLQPSPCSGMGGEGTAPFPDPLWETPQPCEAPRSPFSSKLVALLALASAGSGAGEGPAGGCMARPPWEGAARPSWAAHHGGALIPHPLIPSNHDNWQELSSRPQASHHRGPHGGVLGQQLSLHRCCMPPDCCCRGGLWGGHSAVPKRVPGASRGRDGAGCWGCGEGRDGAQTLSARLPLAQMLGVHRDSEAGVSGGGLP